MPSVPIDLIPDFIPVLGYLDDLLLVPLGIYLALKLIPPDVMADARRKSASLEDRPVNWLAAVLIVASGCCWQRSSCSGWRNLLLS